MSSVLPDSTAPRAACLTPPSVGGIAVIQVVGLAAVRVLANHLRKVDKSSSPVDLLKMSASELRLCRIVEGDEVLDDVVACIRKNNIGEYVIDLSMHGGMRIVQRVLLMLQREGVTIVDPQAFIRQTWPARTGLQGDVTEALLQAKTRRVAIWLARLPDLLTEQIKRICELIYQGNDAQARQELGQFIEGGRRARLLVLGARVVLLGPPNSGKSTLANVLSEREQAVVSRLPGTTRDWTEHPAAISGVPLTIIDTAGVRDTDDDIEREAIRRTFEQMRQSDLVLHVLDGAMPDCSSAFDPAIHIPWAVPLLVVRNKADLFAGSQYAVRQSMSSETGLCISAITGWGLEQLRHRILEALGLPGDSDWPVAPFTAGQLEVCSRAYDILAAATDDRTLAVRLLQDMLAS